jgi:hypothetical protein
MMSQTGSKSAGTCPNTKAFDHRHDSSYIDDQHHQSSCKKSRTYSGISRWLNEKPFEEPWNTISRMTTTSGVYAKEARL